MSTKLLDQIALPADPAAALEAATKQYVDGKAGSPVSGNLQFFLSTGVESDISIGAAAGGAQGPSRSIQYNNGGAFAGSSNVVMSSDGNLLLSSDGTTPATPPANTVAVFGRNIANRQMVAMIGPSGLDTALQPLMARNKVGYWCPPGNATTAPGVFGLTAVSNTMATVARNVATTNLATRMRRLGYAANTTAGTIGSARIAAAQFSCGSGSADGSGFLLIYRWVEADPAPVSGRRAFGGMTTSTSAPTNVEPSTLTNAVGICQLSTDATQWYWYQAGSSVGTPVAIGTTIGAPAGNSTTAWELAIFAPNSVANTYYLQLTNISTGVVATTTMTGNSTQIPQSSSLLAWRHWVTNNATALACGFDLCSIYVETDN